MNAVKTDADKLARYKIANEIDKNFFVEAGAGSGKTTGLTDRMLAMVREGIDVSRICAITFTKAAAREFYGRFRDKLAKALREEKDEQLRSRYENGLKNIDLCFMGTIDSFCFTILSEHPNEAAIPASASIIEDDVFAERCKLEYAAILEGEYGDEELLRKAKLFNTYFPKSRGKEVFCALVDTMISHRESEIVYEPPTGDPDSSFAELHDRLRTVCQSILDNEDKLLLPREDVKVKGSTQKVRDSYDIIVNNSEALKGRLSEDISAYIAMAGALGNIRFGELPADIMAAAPELFEFATVSKTPLYRVNEDAAAAYFGVLAEEQYSAAVDLVYSAVKAIAKRQRERGELTFFDCLLYLRDLLKEDAAKGGRLISYINRRYSCYLVDEFQDTDPLQAEIIFYLTAEQPVEKWYECKPRAGSLFIVGDPKQSIYSFKGADVSSFLRVRRLFEEGVGEVLTLSRNFRSTEVLCSWFNGVFTELLPEDTRNNSKFTEIPVADKAEDIGLTGVYSYKTYESTPGEKDIDKLPMVINSLVGDPSRKISRKDSDGNVYLDEIRYSDIMVIVRSKKSVGQYMDMLNEQHIPVMAEGKINFGGCMLLSQMYTAAKAIAAPDDGAAVYGVLCSPLFGISERELIALRDKKLWLSLFSHDSEELSENPRVKDALDKLYGLYARSAALSPSAAMGLAAQELGLFERCDGKDMECYYYAMELLRSAESSGEVMTLKDGAALLGELLDGTRKEERCISLQSGLDRVRLANLHKVKGLEAPVVILASPGGKRHSPTCGTIRKADSEEFRVFAVENDDYIRFASTDRYPDEREYEAENLAAEHLRLMYVAATRAEKLLIIASSQIKTGAANCPYWRDLADGCTEDFFTRFGTPADDRKPAPRTAEDSGALMEKAVCTDVKSAAETYSIKRPSDLPGEEKVSRVSAEEVPADTESTETAVEDADTTAKSVLGIPAKVMGTMVHKLMEILVSSKGKAQRDPTVDEIISDYWQEDAAVEEKLKSVYDRMTSGGYIQKNGREADLLTILKDAECHCELPFCTFDRESGEMVNGVMDLVYRKGDKWYIVDYKTNADGEGLDVRYASQLAAYRRALRELMGVESESYIYHIAIV